MVQHPCSIMAAQLLEMCAVSITFNIPLMTFACVRALTFGMFQAQC